LAGSRVDTDQAKEGTNQRRFARAIRPQQARSAGRGFDGQVAQGRNGAVGFGDVTQLKQHHSPWQARACTYLIRQEASDIEGPTLAASFGLREEREVHVPAYSGTGPLEMKSAPLRCLRCDPAILLDGLLKRLVRFRAFLLGNRLAARAPQLLDASRAPRG